MLAEEEKQMNILKVMAAGRGLTIA